MVLALFEWPKIFINDIVVRCQMDIIPYLREKGPMGNTPYIGPRLGDGPKLDVSVLQLDAKKRPGIKIPMGSS